MSSSMLWLKKVLLDELGHRNEITTTAAVCYEEIERLNKAVQAGKARIKEELQSLRNLLQSRLVSEVSSSVPPKIKFLSTCVA